MVTGEADAEEYEQCEHAVFGKIHCCVDVMPCHLGNGEYGYEEQNDGEGVEDESGDAVGFEGVHGGAPEESSARRLVERGMKRGDSS